MSTVLSALLDPARPVFLFGSTPPKDGTTVEKAKEACAKFAARSAVLATDGFIVYDIQDEGSRTTTERPFPFRKTMDPSLYASFFPAISGKECVVYKCVVEDSSEAFDQWLDRAIYEHGHRAFNLVGAASSSAQKAHGVSLVDAGNKTTERNDSKFGCVCIPERHTTKGNEHSNLIRKSEIGAEWFITQGIFDPDALIKLMHDYSDLCKEKGVLPKKMILTFAPCGRPKTMTFIKWLGMQVPAEIEERIFASANPVQESIKIHCEILARVLEATATTGIPLGINVESLSIFKEEIDAAHDLFQKLQAQLLNSYKRHWAIRWFFVDQPLIPVSTASLHGSAGDLTSLTDIFATENRAILATGSATNLAAITNAPAPTSQPAEKQEEAVSAPAPEVPVRAPTESCAVAKATCCHDGYAHIVLSVALVAAGFVAGRISATNK
eukprot:gene2524-1829_t